MFRFAEAFTRLKEVHTAGPLRGTGILDHTALPKGAKGTTLIAGFGPYTIDAGGAPQQREYSVIVSDNRSTWRDKETNEEKFEEGFTKAFTIPTCGVAIAKQLQSQPSLRQLMSKPKANSMSNQDIVKEVFHNGVKETDLLFIRPGTGIIELYGKLGAESKLKETRKRDNDTHVFLVSAAQEPKTQVEKFLNEKLKNDLTEDQLVTVFKKAIYLSSGCAGSHTSKKCEVHIYLDGSWHPKETTEEELNNYSADAEFNEYIQNI